MTSQTNPVSSLHVPILSCSKNSNLISRSGRYCRMYRSCITTEVMVERRPDIKTRRYMHKLMLYNHDAYVAWLSGSSDECMSERKKSNRTRTRDVCDGEIVPNYNNPLLFRPREILQYKLL